MTIDGEHSSEVLKELMSAPRPRVLHLLASTINHLTVVARTTYGQANAESKLVEINETIHRLSGHLRDLTAEYEKLTVSQAGAIVLGLQQLPLRTQAALKAQLKKPRGVGRST